MTVFFLYDEKLYHKYRHRLTLRTCKIKSQQKLENLKQECYAKSEWIPQGTRMNSLHGIHLWTIEFNDPFFSFLDKLLKLDICRIGRAWKTALDEDNVALTIGMSCVPFYCIVSLLFVHRPIYRLLLSSLRMNYVIVCKSTLHGIHTHTHMCMYYMCVCVCVC